MTIPHDTSDLLVASTDELYALQRRIGAGTDIDRGLQDAIAMCLDAHSALLVSLACAQPSEPAEVTLARYRRRWRGRLLQWGVFGPLILVGILLLGVVIVTLVAAFVWRP